MLGVQGEIKVDVGFWGGVVPENAGDAEVLKGMVEAGAFGFKSFMIASGESFTTFPRMKPVHNECITVIFKKIQFILK